MAEEIDQLIVVDVEDAGSVLPAPLISPELRSNLSVCPLPGAEVPVFLLESTSYTKSPAIELMLTDGVVDVPTAELNVLSGEV